MRTMRWKSWEGAGDVRKRTDGRTDGRTGDHLSLAWKLHFHHERGGGAAAAAMTAATEATRAHYAVPWQTLRWGGQMVAGIVSTVVPNFSCMMQKPCLVK